MRIMLTGASGFIGRCLTSLLLSDCRHEIFCLVRPGTPCASGVTPVLCDLARHATIETFPSVETIIHLAQSHQYRNFPIAAEDIFAINTLATARLLDCARQRGVQRFILASTASVYSACSPLCREDAALQPDDFYAATKVAAEALMRPYASQYRTCVLRLFTPYGPGQRNRLIPLLIERVRERRPITLDGEEGGLRLSVAYVDDVAATFRAAAEEGWQGTYNVAAPEPTCVREISNIIGSVLGITPVFKRTGQPEPSPLVADLDRLVAMFDPGKFCSLAEGIHRTLAKAVYGSHPT
jgi:nucleoside-diphosphate-sugar epimerase